VADHPANSTPPHGPLWQVAVDSIEEHTGTRNVIPTVMPATTDARFFRSRGVTAYGVGLFDSMVEFPDFLSMFHGHDERVSLESVDLTTRLLSTLLERWRARWQ
ncbi:MAG: M20/M25/M40 family metallo-hydrolase, partial [Acidimicrobiia bacterium]|nr:M20/M25/M40 family metallo-hydrolase [Acidimicrobiia bacterium]